MFPTNPRNINHVILYVNDNPYNYYIEATGDPNWYYYPQVLRAGISKMFDELKKRL